MPSLDKSKTVKASRFAYVRSLERGLTVITSFNEERPEQTLTDVAKSTGLDRAAARRFLLTLETLGYVDRTGKMFRLRPQTMQLGYAYLASLPWWRAAQNVSEALTKKIQLSSAVGVLDHTDVVYVAYASAGRFPLLANRSVGTHLPAITTAIGRVLVAALPPEEMRSWLSKVKVERYTSRTVTDRADLARLLGTVRSTGFSVVDQELEIGLRTLGVPIRNKGGAAVGGLSVSLIEAQVSRDTMIKRYLRPLQSAAKEITSSLAV
jgi:IclR family pca regulon transcriptional regulator